MVDGIAVRAWDAEYASGRYSGEPPVGLVDDIVTAAKDAGADRGLYIGCGNGRNYIPLTEAGLDLTGLDISATAISQLAARLPRRRNRLATGDLPAPPPGPRFPLVAALPVVPPGARAPGHPPLAQAIAPGAPGRLPPA